MTQGMGTHISLTYAIKQGRIMCEAEVRVRVRVRFKVMRFMVVLQLAAHIQGKPLEDNHSGAIFHK